MVRFGHRTWTNHLHDNWVYCSIKGAKHTGGLSMGKKETTECEFCRKQVSNRYPHTCSINYKKNCDCTIRTGDTVIKLQNGETHLPSCKVVSLEVRFGIRNPDLTLTDWAKGNYPDVPPKGQKED